MLYWFNDIFIWWSRFEGTRTLSLSLEFKKKTFIDQIQHFEDKGQIDVAGDADRRNFNWKQNKNCKTIFDWWWYMYAWLMIPYKIHILIPSIKKSTSWWSLAKRKRHFVFVHDFLDLGHIQLEAIFVDPNNNINNWRQISTHSLLPLFHQNIGAKSIQIFFFLS